MKSEPGAGSTFTAEVQLAETSPSVPVPRWDDAPLAWVVEPHPMSRRVIRRQLEARGARVRCFETVPARLDPQEGKPRVAVIGSASDPGALGGHFDSETVVVVMTSVAECLHGGSGAAMLCLAKPLGVRGLDAIEARLRGTPIPVAGGGKAAEGLALPLRVLVVEDNPVNQKVAVRMLERLGASVVVAGDGLEALETLRASFDVVLMDCQMPRMDGFAATRAIRGGEAGAEAAAVRVVALTANAVAGDKERCIAAGMDAYLAKPFRTRALVEILSEPQG